MSTNTENLNSLPNNKLFTTIIAVLSVAIPVVVALLLFIPQTGNLGDLDVSFLPKLNAVLNSSTAILLLAGLFFIKQKNVSLHRVSMFGAFALSSLFLVSYVIYHFQAVHTLFGDLNHDGIVSESELANVGNSRLFYFILLLTHILLAIAVVPLVLFAIYFAISNQIAKHKSIVKWTYPVWLYVAVTGVIVYLMISPFYK